MRNIGLINEKIMSYSATVINAAVTLIFSSNTYNQETGEIQFPYALDNYCRDVSEPIFITELDMKAVKKLFHSCSIENKLDLLDLVNDQHNTDRSSLHHTNLMQIFTYFTDRVASYNTSILDFNFTITPEMLMYHIVSTTMGINAFDCFMKDNVNLSSVHQSFSDEEKIHFDTLAYSFLDSNLTTTPNQRMNYILVCLCSALEGHHTVKALFDYILNKGLCCTPKTINALHLVNVDDTIMSRLIENCYHNNWKRITIDNIPEDLYKQHFNIYKKCIITLGMPE